MNTVRIRQRAKEKGISLSFICDKLNLTRGYFNGVDKLNSYIPAERLSIIANILDTTPEYLMGETDEKEKQSYEFPDDIPEHNKELYSLVKQVPPERRQEVLTFLKYLIDSSDK